MSGWMLSRLLVAASAVLIGCGADKEISATQVVAKVNTAEITIHQVNYLLQRTPGVTPETLDASSRLILEHLINQELAVQKAIELKLDRSPGTVQALEAARREVLARAYLEILEERVARPKPDEVANFYAEKRALFKDRKIYTFQEITFSGTASQLVQAQAALTTSKSMQQSTDYLRGGGLKFSVKLTTLAAENLPLELLDKISALSVGQALFLPQFAGTKALILAAAHPEPVDAATAAAAIEKFLLNDRKRVKTTAELKVLRASSKVELLGDFAAGKPSAALVAPVLASSELSALVPAASTASELTAGAMQKKHSASQQ